MKIVALEENKKPHGVEVKALLGDTEFQQLLGHLDNLAVFATETIDEPATAILTGARHSAARYLLFPVTLRRQFKTDDYDFEKLSCGVMKYRDMLYVIYGLPRTGVVEELKCDEQTRDTDGRSEL